MENQYNRQRPPVNKEKRFWHIWGPLFINWGIRAAMGAAATMAFLTAYMAAHSMDTLALYQDQDAMMKGIEKAAEVMLRYTTEIQGAVAFVTIPVMAFLYFKDRKQEKLIGVIPNRKAPAVKYIFVIILAGVVNIALNNLIMIGGLSDYSAEYEKTAEAFYSASLGMQILCLGILVPIAEELVFRGLMYRRMREDTGVVMSVIYSAAIFGLIHVNLVQIVYGTAMGVMLAYLCEKYGSLAAPIAAHITVNLVSILATYFRVYDWMLPDIRIAGTVTVACATAAAGIFLIIRSINERPEMKDGTGISKDFKS
ncbi:MAG: CPBP family intramembrane metalloprotease [Dorea sp.]|nr:CPBP family intramembrane metalloprotease [Dorea sp.]